MLPSDRFSTSIVVSGRQRHSKGVRTRFEHVDLVIIRENTEDLYAGIEFEKGSEDAKKVIDLISGLTGKAIRPDSGISIKPISVFGTETDRKCRI